MGPAQFAVKAMLSATHEDMRVAYPGDEWVETLQSFDQRTQEFFAAFTAAFEAVYTKMGPLKQKEIQAMLANLEDIDS